MAQPNLISGSAGNDVLPGSSVADRIYGGTGSDRLSGGNGNDTLAGGKGVDYLFGGAGNDTFAFSVNDFNQSLGSKPQDYIWDFKGAGGANVAGENDFLRFTGFGVGSTLTKVLDANSNEALATHNPGLSYYELKDGVSGTTYTLAIKDGGVDLVAGDYGFYGSVIA